MSCWWKTQAWTSLPEVIPGVRAHTKGAEVGVPIRQVLDKTLGQTPRTLEQEHGHQSLGRSVTRACQKKCPVEIECETILTPEKRILTEAARVRMLET